MKKTPIQLLTFLTFMLVLLTSFTMFECVSFADDLQRYLSSDLESLMNIELSVAGKKPQKILDTPAAVYVLTQDDIRRSGATRIPEVLRLVPGFEVAQLDASRSAVSARGFNGFFADKLLVLLDGRSVYTPLYGGVVWDELDVMLEDIDRIEVIRGPGASVWGANALNGVINIVTKNARETQGTLLSAAIGSEQRTSDALRYGGSIGENSWYRVYGKVTDFDNTSPLSGESVDDSWSNVRGGFRTEWELNPNDALSFQGDVNRGRNRWDFQDGISNQRVQDDGLFIGGNLLARWQHSFSDESVLTLQSYWDHIERDEPVLEQRRNSFDFSLEHRIALSSSNEFNWGLDYRDVGDGLRGHHGLEFGESEEHFLLSSAFLQDRQTLIPDTLAVTVGSKFEHNSYTGMNVQPRISLQLTPNKKNLIWASVSQAARIPTRVDNEFRYPYATVPLPNEQFGILEIRGDKTLNSEIMLGYELGYRSQATENIYLEGTVFLNEHNHSFDIERGAPQLTNSGIIIPANLSDNFDAEVWGAEFSIDSHPFSWWRVVVGYNFRHLRRVVDDTTPLTVYAPFHQGPNNQGFVRSHIDMFESWKLDSVFRIVESVHELDIPTYAELDLRIAYEISPNCELSIVGQNLLNHDHPEFKTDFVQFTPAAPERGVYGKIVWKFD